MGQVVVRGNATQLCHLERERERGRDGGRDGVGQTGGEGGGEGRNEEVGKRNDMEVMQLRKHRAQ